MKRLPHFHRVAHALVTAVLVGMIAGCTFTFPLPSSTPPPPPDGPCGPNVAVRGNLSRSLEAFESGESARVVFFGGSVTTYAWREQVGDFLEERFPETQFDFINAGLGGTGAELGAFRLEAEAFADGPVDLMFLEFAANGGELEAMEGIVRHARALSPDIDIVQIHIATQWFEETLDAGGIPHPVPVQERVAEHYGNTSLHLYQEVYDSVAAGEYAWEQFSADTVHPTDFGNTVYSTFIADSLEAMWSLPDQTPVAASTPSPLAEHPWEHGALISYEEATSVKGFDLVTDWSPERNGNVKEPISFLASSTPGSTLSFEFEGTMVGLYSVASVDSAWVEYRIDGGEWVDLDTEHDSWFTDPQYRLNYSFLETSLDDGSHTITFRTTATDGTIFRFYRLMVG